MNILLKKGYILNTSWKRKGERRFLLGFSHRFYQWPSLQDTHSFVPFLFCLMLSPKLFPMLWHVIYNYDFLWLHTVLKTFLDEVLQYFTLFPDDSRRQITGSRGRKLFTAADSYRQTAFQKGGMHSQCGRVCWRPCSCRFVGTGYHRHSFLWADLWASSHFHP